MDGTINPVSGIVQQHTAPVVKLPAPAPHVKVPAPAPAEISAPIVSGSAQNEASARQAALSFKDVYAVSDQNFTIFKDVTGKYITRYVSLRDGKITYAPEPAFVKPAPQVSGSPAHIAISV